MTTYDNGKEFAYHMEIAKELKANGYFAHPYHSWERGLNENTNFRLCAGIVDETLLAQR